MGMMVVCRQMAQFIAVRRCVKQTASFTSACKVMLSFVQAFDWLGCVFLILKTLICLGLICA